ncbi:Protein GVQW1 [Plecturocebus cupreus]
MGFHHIGQAGLELLTSGDLPASASQSAAITDVSHRAWPDSKISTAYLHGLDQKAGDMQRGRGREGGREREREGQREGGRERGRRKEKEKEKEKERKEKRKKQVEIEKERVGARQPDVQLPDLLERPE